MKIALAGNPNSGKTTLFNAITGSNQFVGNWPGVTVEKKEGKLKNYKDVTVVDLPGIYSLSPYTLEEVVARNYLITQKPDAILNIVDGTNLERNLYLTSQLIEIGIPVVIAINMIDLVNKHGHKIDLEKLSQKLGCKVVKISALKGEGVTEACEETVNIAKNKKNSVSQHYFCGSVEHCLAHIEEAVLRDLPKENQKFFSIKIFERDKEIIKSFNIDKETIDHIEEDIKSCEKEMDDDSESIITNERYNYITSIIKDCYKSNGKGKLTNSDKIDKILTNRWLAIPIFAIIMFIVYFISVTIVGSLVSDWANEGLFGEGWKLFGIWVPGIPTFVGDVLNIINCADWLQGLILDGIIAGVGAVLGFVPQMFILFLFLGFLESCGYMARIAFIMDKVFRRFGLSGKSFIPMLIGTGCGVPGIMSSRTIENDKNRKMTIITTTFIPCGAKLPIIALIAGAMFDGAWWVAPSAYFVGIISIVVSGIMLKKTKMFLGAPAPFVMELPSYHMPTVANLLRSMWERGWSFIQKAGTLILLASIVIWFTSNFGIEDGSFGMVDMNYSILAYIGNIIAPVFNPIGWGNWQGTVATITGLMAKESIVSTFGILFNGSDEISQNGLQVFENLQNVFTPLSAYSFLVFNLICAPCIAAMAAIKKEMNSAKWTVFAISYQCIFAYVVSLIVYQIGMFLKTEIFNIATVFAIAAILYLCYMLFRPYKQKLY